MRFTDLPTPCFIIDENRLVQNLAVLRDVARRSGAKILLAQKAFSMFSTYPLLREYLAGTTASGLFEARLGHEEFGGETHVYSPAYTPDEFHEILNYADHIVFNSFTQWKKYGNLARVAGKSCGLRLNPECSTQPDDHAIYDPCGPTSPQRGLLSRQAVGGAARAVARSADLQCAAPLRQPVRGDARVG